MVTLVSLYSGAVIKRQFYDPQELNFNPTENVCVKAFGKLVTPWSPLLTALSSSGHATFGRAGVNYNFLFTITASENCAITILSAKIFNCAYVMHQVPMKITLVLKL